MYVSQQAISHGIRELEEEYGIRLLERTTHRTILTEGGIIVADAAQEIFQKITKMESQLQALSGAIKQEEEDIEAYTILLNEQLKAYYANLIIRLYQEHPESVIKTDEGQLADMVSKVVDHQADIGFDFITDDELNNWDLSKSVFAILEKRPLYVYVSEQSHLASHKTLSLKTIAKYPIMLFGQEESSRSLMSKILNQYVPDQEIKYLNNIPMEVMSEIMINRQAVALRPRFGKEMFIADCVEIKVKENVIVYSGYFYRTGMVLSQAYVALLQSSLIVH